MSLLVAALYDVHGNLPALEAVLAELDDVRPDTIVFGGDVAAGPLPRQTIALLRSLEGARFVRGNCERDMLDGVEGHYTGWQSEQLNDDDRSFLTSFEPSVVLDDVLYCHATPTDDMPFITVLTPDDVATELIGDVEQPTIVVGHTHSQFDRRLGSVRLVNAGSVGMPYEDAPGAYWALVRDGEIELRRTSYDLRAAADRVRQGGWPWVEEWIQEKLISVDPAVDRAAWREAQRG